MAKKIKSEALRSVHESAQALYDIGAISTKVMREFDQRCDPIEHRVKVPPSDSLATKRR